MSTTGVTVDELARRRLARAASDTDPTLIGGRQDWSEWLAHLAGAAAGCADPIRLTRLMGTVEAATGRITGETHPGDLPDAVLYVPCGNRRPPSAPPARRPTAPTPTNSSPPVSSAVKAFRPPSPSTRVCS